VLLGGKAIADGTSRVPPGTTTEVSPMNLLGTFAPHMTVHKDFGRPRSTRTFPFETAAIMGCAVPTGFGSATKRRPGAAGETVVIVGVGGIGNERAAGRRHVGRAQRHRDRPERVEARPGHQVRRYAGSGLGVSVNAFRCNSPFMSRPR